MRLNYKHFAKKVAKARKKLGVTQAMVSDAVDITESYYCSIENGRGRPGLEKVVKIANYYNLTLAECLYDEKPEYAISDETREIMEGLSVKGQVEVLDYVSNLIDSLKR